MKNILPYYINPFESKDISLAKLIAFSTDHLERLSSQNDNGWLSDRIAATSTALSSLEDAYTENFTKLGFRKAQKKAKNTFRKFLAGEVAKIVSAVVAHFGENSAEVNEVVPQGRSAFTNATDDLVERHIETMLNGLIAHQAELGTDLVNQAQDLRMQWVAIYNASEQASGLKAATEEEQRLAKSTLQLELFVTLLILAKRYPNQPERSRIFMQPYLLGYRGSGVLPAIPPAMTSDGGGSSAGGSTGSTGSVGSSGSTGSVGSTGSSGSVGSAASSGSAGSGSVGSSNSSASSTGSSGSGSSGSGSSGSGSGSGS